MIVALAAEHVDRAAEVAAGIDAELILRKAHRADDRVAEIERRDEVRLGALRDVGGVADVIEVSVGDEDQIGLHRLDVVLAGRVRRIRDPRIDEQRLAARQIDLERCVAEPFDGGLAGSSRGGRGRETQGDGYRNSHAPCIAPTGSSGQTLHARNSSFAENGEGPLSEPALRS